MKTMLAKSNPRINYCLFRDVLVPEFKNEQKLYDEEVQIVYLPKIGVIAVGYAHVLQLRQAPIGVSKPVSEHSNRIFVRKAGQYTFECKSYLVWSVLTSTGHVD